MPGSIVSRLSRRVFSPPKKKVGRKPTFNRLESQPRALYHRRAAPNKGDGRLEGPPGTGNIGSVSHATLLAPNSHPSGAGDRSRTSRPEISNPTLLSLPEPDASEALSPWPPPGGLAPEQDPLRPAAAAEPVAYRATLLEGPPEKKREPWRLNVERGVTYSLILHLTLAVLILIWPRPERPIAEEEPKPDIFGLQKLLAPPPREASIPVQFFPAPGPAAKAPGPEPVLSDKNRVAAGGDPNLPKATQPKAVADAGIRDLARGKPGESGGAAAAEPSRGIPQAEVPPAVPPAEEEWVMESPSQRGGAPTFQPAKRLSGIPSSAVGGLTAEKIARASGPGEGGDGGAGFERDGGFVDSGPLSFDTKDYDWGTYAAEMIRRIKLHWDVPALARYGIKGKLTIRFFIRGDGRVEGLRIAAPSGIPPYDNAAFQAIATSSPFRPLPTDLGSDREGVTVTFFYNIRPEDEPGPPRPR